MKRLILIAGFMFFIPLSLFADEADEKLSEDTSPTIRESVREIAGRGMEKKTIINMTRNMLENNFSEQQILKVYDILIEAKQKDLPEKPLINKVYEGVSKKVGTGNILQALEKVRSRYETAGSYARRITRDKEQIRTMTQDIAECMAAGMEKNDMARITEMLQQRKNNMGRDEEKELGRETIRTVRGMSRIGAGSGEIMNMVDNSFQRGYGPREMKELGDAFMKQAVTFSSPSELVRSYSNAIKEGVPPDKIDDIGISDPGPGSIPPGSGTGPGPEPGSRPSDSVSNPPTAVGPPDPAPQSSPPEHPRGLNDSGWGGGPAGGPGGSAPVRGGGKPR